MLRLNLLYSVRMNSSTAALLPNCGEAEVTATSANNKLNATFILVSSER